jgi:predicted O-methyltransferase YrrM
MPEALDERLAGRVDAYIEALFVPRDDALERGLKEAEQAGLPAINVSANEGKLLYLITRIAGARRVLEIGLLGGYSTTWLARALPPDGKVVSLELDQKHAELARANLDRAGVGDRIEIRVGYAIDTLRAMVNQGEEPFDVIFIDADKESYVDYLHMSIRLSRPGTVILADNVVRGGCVLEENPPDSPTRGVRDFNRAMAAHPRLDSLILPIFRERLDGLAISIVK